MENAQPLAQPEALVPSIETDETQAVVASQWRLIWWKFRKHRLVMLGGIVTLFIYFVALFADFFAPFPPDVFASTDDKLV